MYLGSNLFQARKKSGLSQEEVAERLGVSRQTISKWELDETLPDIRQAKKLMIEKGHTYYQSRKLDRVPREAVEELLGIRLSDHTDD